ncbi:hypothetical protein [Methanoregula sp.]|uniref:hypothetical protein n=1 Tax=Methanoregula sp. TaxID=2052170 RepID=UPI003BAE5E93
MRLKFSDIGHWIGWCPKKRRSQIVLEQDFMGITTTGGFTMDEQAPDRKIDTREGMDKWLSTYLKLVGLELVLSVIFISLGYISGNKYFRGVGIGLLIAWVTGAIAYFVVRKRA